MIASIEEDPLIHPQGGTYGPYFVLWAPLNIRVIHITPLIFIHSHFLNQGSRKMKQHLHLFLATT